jgi:predicted AlkP superfamily pyrophosphatase or phosphodiesterase
VSGDALRFVAGMAVALAIGSAPSGPRPRDRHGDTPGLIVVVVVDQMRADYFARYGRHWRAGLHRLITEGASFDRAAYPYLNTVTCAGHATIGTGRLPLHHGIVRSQWYDRTSGRVVGCTHDEDARTLGPTGSSAGGDTPRLLLAPTLAERLKQGGGRVVAISLKACAAIGLAGSGADAVLWFGGSGTFVTSTAYGATLPLFALETLEAHPIEADRAQTWSKALPPDAYVGEDGAAGERPPAGWTNLFPHPLDSPVAGRFVQRWMRAPYADDYTARLARAAIDALDLGGDERPDFLGVSFSALDLIGHSFGPDSHEVQDALARLDRTIGTLLDYLDTRVGRGRYVLALTSDHGVAPVPEQLRARGTDAGRLSALDIRDATEAALPEYLGAGPHVATVLGNEIYLRPGVWERLAPNRAALRALSAAVTRLPGVERLLHRDELTRLTDGDRARRAAALSYFPGRSGDLVVVPRKHWVMTSDATTHGTHHDYDQRAPLVLFGAGIRPGRYADRVSPADIAPTFAALVGLAVTAVDGRPLGRALLPTGVNAPGSPPVRTTLPPCCAPAPDPSPPRTRPARAGARSSRNHGPRTGP